MSERPPTRFGFGYRNSIGSWMPPGGGVIAKVRRQSKGDLKRHHKAARKRWWYAGKSSFRVALRVSRRGSTEASQGRAVRRHSGRDTRPSASAARLIRSSNVAIATR